MTDQLDNCAVCGLSLNDHWLASCPETADPACQPLTWDGQPLYSPDTVREGLFDPKAFEQTPGQLPMETPIEISTLAEGWDADPDWQGA